MRKEVVNLENLGYYIQEIEKLLEEKELNITEQQIILQQILSRIELRLKKQQANDLIDSNPIIRMAKKFMPKEE